MCSLYTKVSSFRLLTLSCMQLHRHVTVSDVPPQRKRLPSCDFPGATVHQPTCSVRRMPPLTGLDVAPPVGGDV